MDKLLTSKELHRFPHLLQSSSSNLPAGRTTPTAGLLPFEPLVGDYLQPVRQEASGATPEHFRRTESVLITKLHRRLDRDGLDSIAFGMISRSL